LPKALLAKKEFVESLESNDLDLVAIPPMLFHPYRVLILKMLFRHAQMDFRDIQSNLGVTSGNLASHLRTLRKNGFIREHKKIVGNRPRTSYEITKMGIYEFMRFKKQLIGVLRDE